MHKILIPQDDTPEARAALVLASRLARLSGARLVLALLLHLTMATALTLLPAEL